MVNSGTAAGNGTTASNGTAAGDGTAVGGGAGDRPSSVTKSPRSNATEAGTTGHTGQANCHRKFDKRGELLFCFMFFFIFLYFLLTFFVSYSL